jgi:hypothetical protein
LTSRTDKLFDWEKRSKKRYKNAQHVSLSLEIQKSMFGRKIFPLRRLWPEQRYLLYILARFFLVQHTKMGKNTLKWPQDSPNGHKVIWNGSKIDRMAKTLTNNFHWKTLQNLPKLGFLAWKYVYHLATLICCAIG